MPEPEAAVPTWTIQFEQEGVEVELICMVVVLPWGKAAVVKVAAPVPSPTMNLPRTTMSSVPVASPRVTFPCLMIKVLVALGADTVTASWMVQEALLPLKISFQKDEFPLRLPDIVFEADVVAKVTVEEAELKVPELYQEPNTDICWVEDAVNVPRISRLLRDMAPAVPVLVRKVSPDQTKNSEDDEAVKVLADEEAVNSMSPSWVESYLSRSVTVMGPVSSWRTISLSL